MKRFSVLLFSCLFSFAAQAYPDFMAATWHKGAIVLNTHDVVRGNLRYNEEYDMIVFQSGGKIQTFSPSQVIYFHYIDNPTGVVRQFRTLSYHTHQSASYQRNHFFEIILEGKVSFLRKGNKRVSMINKSKNAKYLNRLDTDKTCYDYFMFHDDKLVEINDFSEEVLPLLAREAPQNIYAYIDAKNITKFTLREQAALIHIYNTSQLQPEDLRLVQKTEIGR